MPIFGSKKKKTKTQKTTESSSTSVTTSTNGRNMVTTVETSYNREISSSSHSSETVVVDSRVYAPPPSTTRLETQLTPAPIPRTPIAGRVTPASTSFDLDARLAKPRRSVYTTQPYTLGHKDAFPTRTFKVPPSLVVIPPQSSQNEFDNKLKVVVTPSLKFYDDPTSHVPMYKTRSKKRGKLLLINNMHFINTKDVRIGAELDEANITYLFQEFGFEIVNYRNVTKSDMEKKVKKFRESSSLKDVDIGCVVVMSHGTGHERSDSTQVLCSDNQLIETTWIIEQFTSTLCKHLNGKPKIFIFQCCRGNSQDVQYDAVPMPIERNLSDMLLAYSTIPGYVSHRDPANGTLYIQALCKVFMEHAHNTHVENLLKIVDDRLAKHVSLRQTSSFENRGFKTCYFHPKLTE